jgi:hypothetical protein
MISIVKQSLMITSFVFVMMLLIEYINVLTKGEWQKRLTKHLWSQYVLTAFLGATPGCLGPFAVVAMYSHGILSLGAVVTAMIATSGDEAFILFATIPKQAFIITIILFTWGITVGSITDFLIKGKENERRKQQCSELSLHQEDTCVCFSRGYILTQWKKCIPTRGILAVILIILIVTIIFSQLGPSEWNWIRITVLVAGSIALFIVSTVPDHFLVEHLWRHVVIKHVPRIFLWTIGTLTILYFLTEYLSIDLTNLVQRGKWIVLLLACLIGLIPESGPHLIFVTLYAQGMIPISILLASSIVQDGHGMLPMLAYSRHRFLIVKGINFAAGVLLGAVAMVMGF